MQDASKIAFVDLKKLNAVSFLGLLLVAVFVTLCGYYIVSHWEDFSFVATASLPETAVAGFLVLMSYLVNSFQLHLFLRKFGVHLEVGELVLSTVVMVLGNLVLPMRGGTGGLAVYLRKVHGLDFQAFAVIYGGTALLVGLINSSLALIVLVMLGYVYNFTHKGLTICTLAIFSCCIYLAVFAPRLKLRDSKILGPIFRAANSWHLLTLDRHLLAMATGSLLIISLLLMAAFYFIFQALGTHLSVAGVIITSSFGNIANLFPISPGSLGIFDAVVIQIPQLFGMDTAQSIAAALVFRILCFFWAVIVGLPGMLYLFRNANDKRF